MIATDLSARTRARVLAVGLLPLLGLFFGYFVRDPNWNSNSRLCLVFAVVDHGSLAIDECASATETLTGDKAIHDGHFYSEKAIGASMLGVIGYTPIRTGSAPRTGRGLSLTQYWITLVAIGLPLTIVFAYWAFLWLQVDTSTFTVFAITATALATPLFPFSSLFFGHALAAALLLGAFLLVSRPLLGLGAWTPTGRVLLGVALGMAVITEFTVAPAAAVIGGLYLLSVPPESRLKPISTWLAPALGALPFIGLQLLYNWKCFGSPFSLGYSTLATPTFQAVQSKGLLGVSLPDWHALYYITLHPTRGLFVQSPVLLLGLCGLVSALVAKRWRVLSAACLLITVLHLSICAGYGMWWGGYSFTPRHLIPVIPFLGMGLLGMPKSWRPWAIPLTIISFVQMLIAAAGNPLTSDRRLVAALTDTGYLPLNFGSEIWGHMLPRLVTDPSAWASNLGQVLLSKGPATLIPLGLALAVGTYFLVTRNSPVDRN